MHAWSDIYQWKDENGQIHFSDRAPSKATSKEISTQLNRINITSDLSSPEMMLRHEQAKEDERKKHYETWQEQKKSNAIKKKNCKDSKRLLKK